MLFVEELKVNNDACNRNKTGRRRGEEKGGEIFYFSYIRLLLREAWSNYLTL